MKKHTLFLLLLLCTVLTACKSEAPQEPVKAEPCPISAVPLDYVPAGYGEGTMDLICNERKLTADWTSDGSGETRQLDAAALLAYEKKRSAAAVLK
ncbi:MAG: hypothetical protein K2O18_19845 [Oscillospiraceae bacterium]|nr:hypothetical protein [Oscillospiraceae bacterium]